MYTITSSSDGKYSKVKSRKDQHTKMPLISEREREREIDPSDH